MTIKVRKLRDHAVIPQYQTPQAAGMDLRAATDVVIRLYPGDRARIPTGIALEMNPGCEAQVRPRSGLAANHGITVLNSPGTIDADYRGEIQVLLIHLGDKPFDIVPGERIAQLVFAPVLTAQMQEVADLSETERGQGGFGSTGVA